MAPPALPPEDAPLLPIGPAPLAPPAPPLPPPTVTHAPFEHVSLPAQDLPHMPQLVRLLAKFTQAPEQAVVPAPQVALHMPFEHNRPAVQPVWQAPQFCGSELRSTQLAPQGV